LTRQGTAGLLAVVAFVVVVLAMADEATPKADAEAAPRLDPDLAVFTVQASHGYEVTIFSSRFSEGLQDLAVFASSSRSTAIYRVPATVTRKSVRAEVGSLGKVAVRAVRVGRKPVLLRSCDGEGQWRIARLAFEGVIEFHGEEGFTDVEAKRAPFDYRTFREFACAGGRPPGKEPTGARLDLHRPEEANELFMHATRLRPGRATEVSVQVDDYDSELETTRATKVIAGPAAFRFDPRLRSATLVPPAPFTGHATYRRGAPPARRWTGNLTVDLPGDSDYPLTGPGLRVTLAMPTNRAP
jgi:hypothetical protein